MGLLSVTPTLSSISISPTMTRTAIITLVLATFLPLPSLSSISASPTAVCLRSCHHCKQMYGHHFSGHLCARSCLEHRGSSRPVCTALPSIKRFLDLSSLADYRWSDDNTL